MKTPRGAIKCVTNPSRKGSCTITTTTATTRPRRRRKLTSGKQHGPRAGKRRQSSESSPKCPSDPSDRTTMTVTMIRSNDDARRATLEQTETKKMTQHSFRNDCLKTFTSDRSVLAYCSFFSLITCNDMDLQFFRYCTFWFLLLEISR